MGKGNGESNGMSKKKIGSSIVDVSNPNEYSYDQPPHGNGS
jgi:hypothetical protein